MIVGNWTTKSVIGLASSYSSFGAHLLAHKVRDGSFRIVLVYGRDISMMVESWTNNS